MEAAKNSGSLLAFQGKMILLCTCKKIRIWQQGTWGQSENTIGSGALC